MENITIKTLLNLLYLPAFIFGIEIEAVMILTILIVIDTITGVVKAIVLTKIKPSSAKFSRGILSKLLLLLIPFVITITGQGAGLNLIWLATGSIAMLCLSETYSIIGNIGAVILKKEILEFDALEFVLKKINKQLAKIITDKYEK